MIHKMIQQKHFVDFAVRVNKQKWLLLYGLGVTGMTFNTTNNTSLIRYIHEC